MTIGIIISQEHSQWKKSSTLKGRLRPIIGRDESAVAVTCNFRFEVRREDEVVELQADHHSARVCESCLVLLTVHRRVHHMKVEKVIAAMATPVPLVAEV